MLAVTGMPTVGFISLAGDVDGGDAVEIGSVATELVKMGVRDVTVDLGRVTSIGTEGVAALVRMDELLDAAGGRMILVGATAATQRVLDVDRLDRAYHIISAHLGRLASCPLEPIPAHRPPALRAKLDVHR